MGKLLIVTKEEARRMIDESPGNTVLVLQYDSSYGISDHGQRIKKKKGKQMVDRSSVVVLSQSNPVTMLNLHKDFFSKLDNYKMEGIVRSIMIPKLE